MGAWNGWVGSWERSRRTWSRGNHYQNLLYEIIFQLKAKNVRRRIKHFNLGESDVYFEVRQFEI